MGVPLNHPFQWDSIWGYPYDCGNLQIFTVQIKLWLELSEHSQELPWSSWLCNKMKCSDSHILIPSNITSDELRVIKRTCCLQLVRVPAVWRMATVSVPVQHLFDLKLSLVVWRSCLQGCRGNCHKKIQKPRRTQKCEKIVKNPWKGREKLVKKPWTTSQCG